MLQTTLDKKLSQISEIKDVKGELRLLRSFIIGLIGKDKEGNYNPRFVKEILRAAKEKPTNSFRNSKRFLEELRKI